LALKKILYIAPALPIGGAEKFLVSLANSFVSKVESQTVISLSSNNKINSEFNESIRFLALPRNSRFDIDPLRALRKIVQEQKPDLIFCLNFFSFFFMRMAMIGSGLNCRVIISYHSTVHVSRREHFLHKLFPRLLNHNDTIITVSQNQAVYTAKAYHIPKKYFRTIRNGIDVNFWHLPDPGWNKAEIRHQYQIPQHASVIIMTAAFRPEKNHSGALNALKLLHTAHNCQAYLLLVGDGVLFEQTRKEAAALNMLDYVRFAGAQKEMRPFYWASNLFTLCSTSVETFSIAALEAMACGIPSVLTRIGGADEMVVSGLNGFLCEPDTEDIARQWSVALKTDFSPENIRNYISENFSAAKMTAEYLQALQRETV
jgi:glycosyltransferase involved in cell wall biosynthesis